MQERIRLVDLGARDAELAVPMEAAFKRCLAHSKFVLGPEVERFEREAAAYLGAQCAIGVSSGTDALKVSLIAAGVGPGDEVVTTPFTFFATIEAIVTVGARPVFVDVDPATLLLDVRRLPEALGPHTRAIVPVHLYGSPVDLGAVCELARPQGIAVIEDAAQAFGATYDGKSAGTWGALGCFSFFPAKVLGALGDGGLVVTDDDQLAQRCRQLRRHGSTDLGEYVDIGGNFRLDAIQAALLAIQLPHVSRWIERRREHAAAYDSAFRALDEIDAVTRAATWNGAVYTLRVKGGLRDELRRYLEEWGIETGLYYSRPAHLEPVMSGRFVAAGSLAESERAASEVLSLPVHPYLRTEQRDAVVDAVRRFFTEERSRYP